MTRAITYATAGDPADVLEAADIASVTAIVLALSAEFDGTYTLDQITDAVQHVSRPGRSAR